VAAPPDSTEQQLPNFDDLAMIDQLGLRVSWGVFGEDDRIGTVNLLTPDRTLAAIRTITTGEAIPLTLPLNEPRPIGQPRKPYVHTIFDINRNTADDFLDSYYLQGSSQWDGLRHVRCREFGFYNGADASSLGVDQWAARGGINGRAVLLDVDRYLSKHGTPLDQTAEMAISTALLEATCAYQNVSLSPGTILLIRTGWMTAYYEGDDERKSELVNSEATPGLEATENMARYLWNNGIAAAATDNTTFEVSPGNAETGSLHRRLIPCLGIPVGELWSLDAVAARCVAESRYEFFVTSVPLYLIGGVGSPPNAIAIW